MNYSNYVSILLMKMNRSCKLRIQILEKLSGTMLECCVISHSAPVHMATMIKFTSATPLQQSTMMTMLMLDWIHMDLDNGKHYTHHILGKPSGCCEEQICKKQKENVKFCFENRVSKCTTKKAKTALITYPFFTKQLVCKDGNIHTASFYCHQWCTKEEKENETLYVSSGCFYVQKQHQQN